MEKIIIGGCECILSKKTIRAYKEECAQIEAERREREELENIRQEAIRTGDWSFYSDVFKDVYGFRPRGALLS